MSYHPLFFDDTAVASLEGSDVQAALRKRRYSEVEAFNSKFVDDKSAVLELEVKPSTNKTRVAYSTSNGARCMPPGEHSTGALGTVNCGCPTVARTLGTAVPGSCD